MKLREIVYMALDELKLHSDDSSFNEEHIIFLADKYRAFLLKLRYSDIKKQIPQANYQEICLEVLPYSPTEPCGELYLRSVDEIPTLMNIGNAQVYPKDFYQGTHIAYISRERMQYVGSNKYLKNIIYCSLNPDNHLYMKSANPQFKYLRQVRMSGVFDSVADAAALSCDKDTEGGCDVLDTDFPLEPALIPPLLELIVKELTVAEYKPEDLNNNSADDLSLVNNGRTL